MAEIDLGRFRRRLFIGAKGDVKVSGVGVLDRHAEIFRGPDGAAWIRSLAPELWVIHGRFRELVARPQRLTDGDVIVVGAWHLRYRSLAAQRPEHNERRVTWIR